MTSMKRWVRRVSVVRDGPSGSTTPRAELPEQAALAALLPPDRREPEHVETVWERLRACAHPALYAAQLPERAARDGMLDRDGAVEHYLAQGARQGRRISAIFHPQWYADRLAERGESVPDGVAPFLHWLAVGWDRRIVPTPLFDLDFYRARHPGVAHPWPFVHYVNRGLYEAHWRPSPVGRHHAGEDDPGAAERREPLLLREMLHRSSEHDLARTSWLEEGCMAALASCRRLSTDRMRALVAKAAAIEPRVLPSRPERRKVSCPPYRHPRLYLTDQVEAARRDLGRTHADTVVLVPGLDADASRVGRQVAAAIRAAEPAGDLLVLGTDEPGPGEDGIDLADRTRGLPLDQRVDLLLDVVRGLTVRRIVTVGSRLGWDLLTTYGRQLSHQASLGAHLPTWDLDESGRRVGYAVTEFRDCFALLDWVLLEDEALGKELADRYLLPAASRRRLVVVGDGEGEPGSCEKAVAAALDLPRRRG